jgi:hypothetical protein
MSLKHEFLLLQGNFKEYNFSYPLYEKKENGGSSQGFFTLLDEVVLHDDTVQRLIQAFDIDSYNPSTETFSKGLNYHGVTIFESHGKRLLGIALNELMKTRTLSETEFELILNLAHICEKEFAENLFLFHCGI